MGSVMRGTKLGHLLIVGSPGFGKTSLSQIVADEIVKAIVGAGGSDRDREEAAASINSANSPAQLHQAIDTAKKLMSGQLGGMRKQYEASTGRKDFDDKFLTGSATAQLGESSGKSPAKTSAGPTKISSDAEYNALPSGAMFVGPDGKTRRKP